MTTQPVLIIFRKSPLNVFVDVVRELFPEILDVVVKLKNGNWSISISEFSGSLLNVDFGRF